MWWLWGLVPLALACGLFCYWSNNALTVSRFEVASDKRKTIVHLSDLHGKEFGKRNIKLINKVRELAPDVICFTGDAVHLYRERDMRVAVQTLTALTAICPVVMVCGNHEMRNKKWRVLRKELSEGGVIVLENDCREVKGISFAGLNAACLKNNTIEKLHGEVLLAHDPRYLEKYASYGYTLVLSGHAHGGQFVIPFTRVGLYAPGQGVLPRYCIGAYQKGKTTMVVSRGLGNSEFPLRLFNCPEIVVVNLKENN